MDARAPRARRARPLHPHELSLSRPPGRPRAGRERVGPRRRDPARGGRTLRVRRDPRPTWTSRSQASRHRTSCASSSRKASATASSAPRSPPGPTITGPSTERSSRECHAARRHRRSRPLHRPAAPARVLRRPRRHAVPRRGDRRDRRTTSATTTRTSALRTRRHAAPRRSSISPTRRPGRSSAARATRWRSGRA